MSLADNPERGHIPPELERIGVYEYREIHVKVYRIIYQVLDNVGQVNLVRIPNRKTLLSS
jgi:mRNA-degrading endonuclease RelE of RelBE toxin-antitoxin system